MAKIIIPINSYDLIKQLEERFPDELDVVDTPPFERGKKAGVVELIRELKYYLKGETVQKNAVNI